MGIQLPPVSLLVPMTTRLVYAIYTGLAIAAYKDAQNIFDPDTASCNDEVCRFPITFCNSKRSVIVSGAGEVHVTYSRDLECMDAGPITNIVSVTAVVSLAAVILYVILDLVVRCRKGCFQALGGVSAGVAAGFGVALSFLLFLSMWCFLTIGTICDYWEKIYSSTTYEGPGKDFKVGLNGNQSFIWAAGVMAVIACAMTAIDAAVLARTMRTGAARARLGEQSATMTNVHNSSCKTEPSRCVTYPSAQQNNGAPAAGASELRVNVDPVSGPTSCLPTPTAGQQASSQPTENPFMKSTV
jgi:hypothetical protein